MDLRAVSSDDLFAALADRSFYGLVALTTQDGERIGFWWGDRTAVLGVTTRVARAIHKELDCDEDECDEEEETEEETEVLPFEVPQIGNYL